MFFYFSYKWYTKQKWNRYAVRSRPYEQLQHKIIGQIYDKIQSFQRNNKDNQNIDNHSNLFKLITTILIFEASTFTDMDKMIRFFDFGYEWFQHPGFETILIPDFGTIFIRIITIFSRCLSECKHQNVLNVAADIITSLSLHFETAIEQSSKHDIKQINLIWNKMCEFYIDILDIQIGSVQFHTVQNIALFLNSLMLCISKIVCSNIFIFFFFFFFFFLLRHNKKK